MSDAEGATRAAPGAPGPDSDVRRIVVGRMARGFADGFVSVLLAQYLTGLGFPPVQVGAIVTGTLLGSAALTLAFGLSAHRTTLRTLLLGAAGLMVATGICFASVRTFWPLLVVAVVGTLNPSAGDVSVFLPTEQALLADRVGAADRPRRFATYNVAGSIAGAFGALASGLPERAASWLGWTVASAQRLGFVLYAVIGLGVLILYLGIGSGAARPSPAAPTSAGPVRRGALPTSRRIVLELSALFSLDAAAGGFVVTALLVVWLHARHGLSSAATAGVFFATGLLAGFSQFLAPRLAARIGLIRTMAFTHLPANALLAAAAFAPNGGTAIALLLARSLLSQMDVPARQAFVMSVVPEAERAAAASVTNVPRSLASATTPLLAGYLLDQSTFGWPLLIAGAAKATYDLLLLALYRNVPEEVGAHR